VAFFAERIPTFLVSFRIFLNLYFRCLDRPVRVTSLNA